MALFSSSGQHVAVGLGNGDGTFGMLSQFTAGATAVGAIAIGDINSDMKPDIVVGDNGSSAGPNDVYVLLGKGDGTFGAATRFSASTGGILLLKLGDLNNDNVADVMVIDHTTSDLITLLSKGDGTLEVPQHTSLPGAETVIAPGDINNDGKLDVLVAPSFGEDLGVLLGKGDGTFQPLTMFATSAPFSVAADSSAGLGDFDGDGNLDAWYADHTRISVFLGKGDGTFGDAVTTQQLDSLMSANPQPATAGVSTATTSSTWSLASGIAAKSACGGATVTGRSRRLSVSRSTRTQPPSSSAT